MASDPLRSTLDNLQVDPEAEEDRRYLEAALRRMGYTEQEIQQQLARALPAPPAASASETDEYRLVRILSAMPKAGATAASSSVQSPFEDLNKGPVQFTEEDAVEFDRVVPQELAFEEIAEEPVEEPVKELVFEAVEDEPAPEKGPADERPLDQFGASSPASAPRTRVRVRRVRAGSRQEAEAKVEGDGRHVIKSIPVDIVERWGGKEER